MLLALFLLLFVEAISGVYALVDSDYSSFRLRADEAANACEAVIENVTGNGLVSARDVCAVGGKVASGTPCAYAAVESVIESATENVSANAAKENGRRGGGAEAGPCHPYAVVYVSESENVSENVCAEE